MNTDVAVVGAGPTGLTLACLLMRRGVSCRLFEADDQPVAQTRAIGVSARSLEVFDELGIADDVIAEGLPSREAVFYSDGAAIGSMSTRGTRHTRFPFLLAVPQAAVEKHLVGCVERLDGTVEWGRAVNGVRAGGDGPSSTVVEWDGQDGGPAATAGFGWVVGADGSHSVVRKSLGVDFAGDASGRVFANVDAHIDNGPQPGVGHYYFHRTGLLVIAPLPDGVYRVTASISSDEADRELTIDDVQGLIDLRCGDGMKVTELLDAGWGVARVTIQTRIAERYRQGPVLLAGDAAHVYGPTGAQGMNGGIQDAHNLAWRLALVCGGRADPGILDAYAAERRMVAAATLHHVELQTKMATLSGPWRIRARDGFLRFASRTKLLDKALIPRISQFDIDYGPAGKPEGARRPMRRSPGVRRLPDVELQTAHGDTNLYSELSDNWFTAVVVGARPADQPAVDALSAELSRRYSDLVETLYVASGEGRGDALVDSAGALGGGPSVTLVRPDRYAAGRFSLDDRAGLTASLDDLLGSPERSNGG